MSTAALPSKKTRDTRVEFLRLFACFAVLGLHARPNTLLNGIPIAGRVLYSCFVTDAVGIFFLITGFYFFRGQRWSARLKSCAVRIVLPMLTYTILITARPLFQVPLSEILKQVFSCILTWTPSLNKTGHLWYLYVYVLLVLLAPVLQFLRTQLLARTPARLGFLAGTLVLFAVNDFADNRLLQASTVPFRALLPACLLVLTGSILYEERSRFENKKWLFWAAPAIFCCINAVRAYTTYTRMLEAPDYHHLFWWFSVPGYLCAILLALFCFQLPQLHGRVAAIVNFAASLTMGVFVLHVWMIELTGRLGITAWLIETFLNGSESLSEYLKFVVLYPILLFILCGTLTLLIRLCLQFPVRLLRRKKQ